MKFRVKFKIGYYERYFDFGTIEEAGAFAVSMIEHDVASEDHPEKASEVAITVIKEEEQCVKESLEE